MADVNRRFVLASRPDGEPTLDNFALEEGPVPDPGDGEILCRTLYLSLDPYMRGRMREAKSYAPYVELGEVMVGGAVSEVMVSKADGFAPGDVVLGYTGWQDYAVTGPKGLRKLDPVLAPVSTALGVLGMPGMTAYTGLKNIGQPKEGETVVVSAASGAVGAIVGQIARIEGCRVVGVAGTPEKCAYLTDELGFDAAVDHRDDGFKDALKAACPDGVDVYWENVGGHVLKAVIPLLNDFARVPVCGQIAHYSDAAPPPGPDRQPLLMTMILIKRLTVRGFIVFDFADQEGEFLEAMSAWVGDERVKFREDIVDGLENAPGAFLGLLKGANFGKLIVRVAPEPGA